jgi:hypothetical protein
MLLMILLIQLLAYGCFADMLLQIYDFISLPCGFLLLDLVDMRDFIESKLLFTSSAPWLNFGNSTSSTSGLLPSNC